MDPQNEREHESTPAAELVEQLTHLAVESCFHPSDGATKRLIDIKVEIIRRLSYAAAGEPYSVPAPFIGDDKHPGRFSAEDQKAIASIMAEPDDSIEALSRYAPVDSTGTPLVIPSPAEVKAVVFPEEPKQAKRKAKP